MPRQGDAGRASSRVLRADYLEARHLEQPLVFTGRAEDVVADGAARSDLLMRNQSANDERIAEEQRASGLQYPVQLGKERGTAGNVAEHVIREHGVKAQIRERQRPGGIADLEAHQRFEMLLGRELIGIADADGVDVEAEDAAADSLGETQGVSARAATDLENIGIGREAEQAGD